MKEPIKRILKGKKNSVIQQCDANTSLAELKNLVKKFVEERNWSQFHTAKNLSMNIVREASELMEYFIWASSQEIPEIVTKNKEQIQDELADVLLGILTFANHYNIDIANAFLKKMEKTKIKYPQKIVYGKNKKYSDY